MTLIAVAELGSMIAAARYLRYAPSTVSAHIAALERHLGTAVISRTPDGSSLTPEGERAVRIARRIVGLYEELSTVVASRRVPPAPREARDASEPSTVPR